MFRSVWWKKILPRTTVFAAVGLLDVIFTLSRDPHPSEVFLTLSPLILSLWVLAGWSFAVAEVLGGYLLLGEGTSERILSRLREWGGRRWSDHRTSSDQTYFALFLSGFFGLAVLGFSSYLSLAYLIEHRHGAGLIAATFLGAQVFLIGVSALCAWIFFRLLRFGLRRMDGGWISRRGWMRNLLVLFPVFGGISFFSGLVFFRSTISALDGFSYLSFLLAVIAQPLGRWFVPKKINRPVVLFILPLIALLIPPLVSTSNQTRNALITGALGSKVVYNLLQRSSDFDGDGAPSYPYFQDCAPFDPSIHPLAKEIPNNGRDENCDGSDQLPKGYEPLRRPAILPKGPPPNLALITLDATRSDHLGFMGYPRKISSNIDALAARSTVFLSAFANDSGTGPSLWALMSGKTPFQVSLKNAHKFPPEIGESETTLAEHLSAAGYRTVAITCGGVFQKKKWNIHRGFQEYREVCSQLRKDGKKQKGLLAEVVQREALKALQRLEKSSEKPFFLWVHFYDPHASYYDHPDLDLGDRPIDHYDEEIFYTDQQLKPLIEQLTKKMNTQGTQGKVRETIIAMTTDHGENFGDHGKIPHARNLYREVTQTPFILYAPNQPPQRISSTVSNGDIYPTFLELAHIPIPKECTKISQAAVLYGAEADSERVAFQENSFSRPKRHVKGIVGRGYHMMVDFTNGTTELYDLLEDPEEKNNLVGQREEIEALFMEYLQAFIQTTHVPKNLAK